MTAGEPIAGREAKRTEIMPRKRMLRENIWKKPRANSFRTRANARALNADAHARTIPAPMRCHPEYGSQIQFPDHHDDPCQASPVFLDSSLLIRSLPIRSAFASVRSLLHPQPS